MCFIILLIHPLCSFYFFYFHKRAKSRMKSPLWERISAKALNYRCGVSTFALVQDAHRFVLLSPLVLTPKAHTSS